MISRKEQHGDCIFVTVSDIGVNHQRLDISNQDAVDFAVHGDDFALAVSDGVGSCSKAVLGSNAAVSAVLHVFNDIKSAEEANPVSIAGNIVAKWKKLLANENLDDCCATLKSVMKLGHKLLLFSIGDGFLAVVSHGMQKSAPTDNRLFSNQTMCLNSKCSPEDIWLSEFRLDTYVPFVAFICSDGVANGIQEGREMQLVSAIEADISSDELQHELESLLVDIADYSSDDRTVGVVKYERKNAKSGR